MNTEELKTWLRKHSDLMNKRDLAMMELLDIESKMDFVSEKILSLVKQAQREKGKKSCAA